MSKETSIGDLLQFDEALKSDLFKEQAENKRVCPCDSCPLSLQCMQNITECSAFRNWASKGDYNDNDLGKRLRGC